jgi:hypothetical protein
LGRKDTSIPARRRAFSSRRGVYRIPASPEIGFLKTEVKIVKNRYWIGVAVVCLTSFCVPARPPTLGTTLALAVHWDDNSAVVGTVTIAAIQAVGPDRVLGTHPLNAGWASVTLALASNSLYRVTILSPAGAHLVVFPITTALVNPQNMQRGIMSLVLRRADQSLKSANVMVSLSF